MTMGKMKFAILAVFALLAACSVPAPTTDQATLYARQYYDALKADDVDKAVQLLGGDEPAEAWRAQLHERLAEHGPLQNYKLGHPDVNTVYSGTLYVVEAHVNYAKGVVNEIMTLRQPVTGGELQIVSVRGENEVK